MKQYPLLIRWTCGLLFGILLVYVLVAARTLLYPLALAMLFSYLLLPAVHRLEKWHLPRPLTILIPVLLLLALVAGAVFLLYKQVYNFASELPGLELSSLGQIERLEHWVAEKTGILPEQQSRWLKEQLKGFFASSSGMLQGTLASTTSTVASIVIMPVYVFFLLYFRNRFRTFVYKLTSSKQRPEVTKVLLEVSKVSNRYMGGVVLVVLILAVLNTTGLLIIGLEYALLLGVISALFNFIPYFGTLIGGAVPLLYSVLSNGFTGQALAILLFFLGVQFLENNILTPRITGGQVQLNPLFTILAIITGGMIWGLPGLIIAVPILAMFRIVCSHVPELEPYAYILGKNEK